MNGKNIYTTGRYQKGWTEVTWDLAEYLLQGAMLVSFAYGVNSIIEKHQKIEARKTNEIVNEEILRDYTPVGNGGALAEMHGNISPERRQMYYSIKDSPLQKCLK